MTVKGVVGVGIEHEGKRTYGQQCIDYGEAGIRGLNGNGKKYNKK